MVNESTLKILTFLIRTKEFVTVKTISQQLTIPARTVRWHLQNFRNEYPDLLEQDHHSGTRISDIQLAEKLSKIGNNFSQQDEKHRGNIVLMELLLSENNALSAASLAEKYYLSISSIKYYIRMAREVLSVNGLEINYLPRKGYVIKASRLEKTQMLTRIIFNDFDVSNLYTYGREGRAPKNSDLTKLFNQSKLHSVLLVVSELAEWDGWQLNDMQFLNLSLFLYPYVIRLRMMSTNSATQHQTVIDQLNQLAVIDIPKSEIDNLRNITTEYGQTSTNQYPEMFLNLMDDLSTQIAHKYNYDIRQNKLLYPLFLRHTYSVIKSRQRSGIVMDEQFDTVEIKENNLFNDIQAGTQSVQKAFEIHLTRSDITLIYLYFATALTNQNTELQSVPKQVLAVCKEGKIISEFQKSVLESTFGDDVKVKAISLHDYHQQDSYHYDLVLKPTTPNNDTAPFNNEVYVNSILSRDDLAEIAHRLHLSIDVHQNVNAARIDELYQIIKRNATVHNQARLDLELIHYFSKEDGINDIPFNRNYIFLQELNQLIPAANTWQEGLFLAMAPLINRGYIENHYYDKIVENIEQFGPYMVVAPGILIAHAGVHEGVIKDCVNLTIFEKPVQIVTQISPESVPIKMIIVTAFTEHTETKLVVQRLIKLVNDRKTLTEIVRSKSGKQIYQLAKEYI